MTDRELEALRRDPANWRAHFMYFRPADPRLWVRKRHRTDGWTINWGHPQAPAMFAAFTFLVGGIPILPFTFMGEMTAQIFLIWALSIGATVAAILVPVTLWRMRYAEEHRDDWRSS